MEPCAPLPSIHVHDDALHHIPAHLQPAAYSDSHPHLATLVSSLLPSLHAAGATSSVSSLLSQHVLSHYTLSLLLHHTQQALTAHPHRFPRLASTLHTADLSYCLRSHGVVAGIAGVTADDVCGGGSAGAREEYEVREEQRLLVAQVERSMAAQLEAMRAAYDDDSEWAEVDDEGLQQQSDADKENVPCGNSPRSSDEDDTPAPTASASTKPTSAHSIPPLPITRPVSAAFVALTSQPTAESVTSDSALFLTGQLQHRHMQQQRQHVALQLHLLSLHSQLLTDHRLCAVHDHDTAALASLQAKAHCLALKLQLMTAHADLLEPAPAAGDSSAGSTQERRASVWTEVLGRLEARRAEVASEVERAESARSGYEAVAGGVHGDEWHEVSARWRDVQHRRKEKQWALKQLAG